jgi:hypothetical protein
MTCGAFMQLLTRSLIFRRETYNMRQQIMQKPEERAFDTTSELWLKLPRKYDIWHTANETTDRQEQPNQL